MLDGGFSTMASIAIYEDCNNLHNGFDRVSIEYCNREANQVAHELARSFFSRKSCIWINEPAPSFIMSVDDVTIFSY